MRRTDRRLRLCGVLLVLNLAVIWGNSLIPGAVSGRISGFVTELLGKLLGMSAGESAGGHGLLRKMAHFTEFACLGMLLWWRFSMNGHRRGDLFCRALLGGVLAACVDETIQIFVDGRASSLIDVWIDICGTAAGMLILLFGHHVLKRKKHKNIMEGTI